MNMSTPDTLESIIADMELSRSLAVLHYANRLAALPKHGFAVPDGLVLVPIEPSLSMLDSGWGICGTKLNSSEPSPALIRSASAKYQALLVSAQRRASMLKSAATPPPEGET